MRVGSALGAIAAADCARHDGGPKRMFSAPGSRVDGRRVEKEREESRPLDGEVRGESPHVGDRARMIEEPIESLEQPPTRHGEPVGRHVSAERAIAQRQGLLQYIADGEAEAGARVIGVELPSPPQQMCKTRLMERAGKAAIRRPPIADDDAREAPAEHTGRFRIAAAGLDPIDRRVRRRHGPQPVQASGDFPAGFIGGHDRTAANPLAQRGIGRARLPGGSVHRVHQSTARDRQTVLLLEQRGDLPEREPELLIEDDGERDRLRAELRARRAQRVRGLQRMAPLHPALAHATLADLDAKRPDDDARHRQCFLILHRHARLADRPTTVRTVVGQRRVVGLIDPARSAATSLASVLGASFATRPAGMRRDPFRERSRVPMRRAPSLVQLPLQPLDCSTQSLALTPELLVLALQLITLASQPIALALGPLRAFAPLVDLPRALIVGTRHTEVMPEARTKYRTIRL